MSVADVAMTKYMLQQGTLNYREYAAYSFQRNLSTVGYQHVWLPYYDLLIFSNIMTVFKAFKQKILCLLLK